MFVDDMGYIAGSGVIINNNVILTAAQLFERSVSKYTLTRVTMHILWLTVGI